jgi:hypothetical protein
MTHGRPVVRQSSAARATRAAVSLSIAALSLSLAAMTAMPSLAGQAAATTASAALVEIGGAVGTSAGSATGAVAVGPTPIAEPLTAQVVLQPRDPAALSAFVQAVATPGSASYHHYLAAGAFAATFGATAATIAQVGAVLRTSGLQVGSAASNGLSLRVSGTVGQFERALSTNFTTYRTSSGDAVANITPPKLGASVAAQVAGIVGLDQLTKAVEVRPATITASGTSTSPDVAALSERSAAAGPAACPAAVATGNATGSYTAAQIAHHYGLDSLYAGGDLGAGVTVGVVELEPFPTSDVAAYQACYGTHTAVSVAAVDGGSDDDSDISEAALDVEDLIGLAPSSKLIVYEAANDAASVYGDYQAIAEADAAQVVSDSWGLCEAEPGVADLAVAERPLFQQMAAQGQTVLAATGDTGSEGCYSPPDSTDDSLSVWDPASQPEVTAVGGTTVASAGSADTSWADGYGAGGGGISTLWPMPVYQRAEGTISGVSSMASCGSTTVPCRETPDVSASADVDHGYLAYFNGEWHAVGGTSAAAPTWSALVSLIDSSCSTGPVGFANPALYELAAAHSAGLVDVTTGGDNDFTGTRGGNYPVTAGYDLSTGLGRPSAVPLDSALCPATLPNGTGSVTVSPSAVIVGAHSTLTFSYTPPTGKGLIDGEIDLTVPGTWSQPSTDPTQPGYVTSTSGTIRVDGSEIEVRGVTAIANQPVSVVYGDTAEGGPGALAPLTAQDSTFSSGSRTTSVGVVKPIALNPALRVLPVGSSGQGTLTRVAGADRIATSVAASQVAYPGGNSASTVVLARDDDFPDALAGVPLAAHGHGPLLLTESASLSSATQTEISRVLAPGHTIYLLGGVAAISTAVETQLQALGYTVDRIAGADRFSTAVDIAKAIGDPSAVFEADGTNFPDALSAGSAAIATQGAILLTNGSKPVAATTAFVSSYPASNRFAIGGPAAQADPTATVIAGSDRYATSALVAARFFNSPADVGVASGATFPDALSGGPAIGTEAGPLVLVPPTGNLPSSVSSYLTSIAPFVVSGLLFGGDSAITPAVASEVAQALVLVPPTS